MKFVPGQPRPAAVRPRLSRGHQLLPLGTTMRVTIQLFARARELARRETVTVELPTGATVGQLRQRLAETMPSLEPLLARCRIAVAEEFANESALLSESSEVALIPPVSGG